MLTILMHRDISNDDVMVGDKAVYASHVAHLVFSKKLELEKAAAEYDFYYVAQVEEN